jgi:rubrerythrin
MAAPELAAIEIHGHGMTRSALLVRATIAAGAVYGASAVTPFVTRAMAQGGDLEILNFALTLEYLEAAFYAQALKDTPGLSSDVKKLAKEIRDNEDEHVDALKSTIEGAGGKAVKAPKVDFGGAFKSEKSFLKLAQTFEDTGVSAYNGAAPQIEKVEILAAAGGIVQVEARHAALIRLSRGETPAPDAFDKTLETQEVLDAVGPFVKM